MQVKSLFPILDNCINNYFKYNKSLKDMHCGIPFKFNNILYLIGITIQEHPYFVASEESGYSEKFHKNEIIQSLIKFIKEVLSSENQYGENKNIIYNYKDQYPFRLFIKMEYFPECIELNILDNDEYINLLKKSWIEKLYNLIQDTTNSGIPLKELRDKTRFISSPEIRKELLQELIANNKILEEKQKSKWRKPITIYKARLKQ